MVVVDDCEGTVVAVPVAVLVAVAVAVAVAAVYALRAPLRENFEGGQLRS